MDASCGLTLRTRREGNAVVVSIRGELDFATTAELVDVIEHGVDDDVRLCLLDCLQVTFIDSEALKVLMKTQNRLTEFGTELRISGCSRQVARILRLLGLDDRFLVREEC